MDAWDNGFTGPITMPPELIVRLRLLGHTREAVNWFCMALSNHQAAQVEDWVKWIEWLENMDETRRKPIVDENNLLYGQEFRMHSGEGD